ncbi:RNase HII [uncultured Gammaproteobacteria bacterium]
MSHPDLSLERAAGFETGTLVCGVDEVGRGPLAGPVLAAAVIWPPAGPPADLAAAINDSKRLSQATRERLAPLIRSHARAVGLALASVEDIDRINILRASLLAMARAVAALGVMPALALIDGRHTPTLPCPATGVIRGDGISLSIAAASIVAKVERDRIMTELAREFPGYGWERNAGYPTAEHRAALSRLGVTPHHRRSFGPVAALLRGS